MSRSVPLPEIQYAQEISMIKLNFTDLRREKAFKEKRNLPLQTISQETGLSYGTIHRLFSGTTDSIHFSTIAILCKYFNCRVADLFEFVPDEE